VLSKKVIALCATVGVAVSGFVLAIPAHADPVSESFAIVGSDTLEDVVGALIQGTSITGSPVRSLVNNAASGSFDATGTPYIITKTSGLRIGRPNGSGDGRKALFASMNGTTGFQASAQLYPFAATGTKAYDKAPMQLIGGTVDLGRASSLATNTVTDGVIVQIPFGRDAIGYVYDSASTVPGIENLTIAQLAQIFEGTTPFNGTSGTTRITAVTPQTGSGTGSDWATMIGSTPTKVNDSIALGNSYGQEHDASTLGINQIMPMSASRWIAMHNGGSYAKFKSTTVMGSIENVSPVTGSFTPAVVDPTSKLVTTPAVSTLTPNATFYNNLTNGKNFGRDTYINASYDRITSGNGKYNKYLADLVDPALSTSLTNYDTSSPDTAGSVKLKYGFLVAKSLVQIRTNN
jgi:hypothetical protein